MKESHSWDILSQRELLNRIVFTSNTFVISHLEWKKGHGEGSTNLGKVSGVPLRIWDSKIAQPVGWRHYRVWQQTLNSGGCFFISYRIVMTEKKVYVEVDCLFCVLVITGTSTLLMDFFYCNV